MCKVVSGKLNMVKEVVGHVKWGWTLETMKVMKVSKVGEEVLKCQGLSNVRTVI